MATHSSDTSFFGHPRGLATLFFTEMWERFSYYGMRAILILFMVDQIQNGGLGWNKEEAGAVYGLYTAMAYLMCLGGGWVADRITGQRWAVLFGGILITLGEFCLFIQANFTLYLGLVLLMIGTGFLKGNVSTIVGQLYAKGDIRRDSGFSVFYMGINLGALISPVICAYIGEKVSWRLGFAVAGAGMLLGLIQYVLGGKHLGEAGLHPASTGDPARDAAQKRSAWTAVWVGVGAFALIGVVGALGMVTITQISDALGTGLLLISAAVFYWLIFGKSWSIEERKRSAAVFVLFIAAALFWASFEQAGSSLNIFAKDQTDRLIMGWEFPAGWFQFVQPIFVVALAPVFAWIWLSLARRNSEPSSPAKFTLGLLFAGLAFVILIPAAKMTEGGAKVGIWWLTGTYLLQTLGELCLSPVGLSAMSKLAPDRAAGFMMGIWFLAASVGNWLAGKAASLYDAMPLPTLFGAVGWGTIAAAVVLALLIKPTVRLMSGVK
jgi:POT family proton-dependent oligopeptide transporter